MTWREHIPAIFKSRYTRALEEEVTRLRDENRALINSILSVSGLPPLRLEAEVARENHRAELEVKARRAGAARAGSEHSATGHIGVGAVAVPEGSVGTSGKEKPVLAAAGQGIVLPSNPHRRRSWQQINRILEIDETRQIINRDNSDAMRPRGPEL